VNSSPPRPPLDCFTRVRSRILAHTEAAPSQGIAIQHTPSRLSSLSPDRRPFTLLAHDVGGVDSLFLVFFADPSPQKIPFTVREHYGHACHLSHKPLALRNRHSQNHHPSSHTQSWGDDSTHCLPASLRSLPLFYSSRQHKHRVSRNLTAPIKTQPAPLPVSLAPTPTRHALTHHS
jgi:hypothetical protein